MQTGQGRLAVFKENIRFDTKQPGLAERSYRPRFKHRFDSRAPAIKWLLAWALDQKPTVPKEG
jgi:hypothetical protein